MAIAIYAVLQTGCLWGFPVLHQILQPIRFWDPNGKLSCHCKCYEQYFFLYILFFNAAETKTVLPLYFWLDHNLILRKKNHQRHQRYRGEQILIDVIAETVVYRSVHVYSTNTSPMNILSTVFSFSWSSGITESDTHHNLWLWKYNEGEITKCRFPHFLYVIKTESGGSQNLLWQVIANANQTFPIAAASHEKHSTGKTWMTFYYWSSQRKRNAFVSKLSTYHYC